MGEVTEVEPYTINEYCFLSELTLAIISNINYFHLQIIKDTLDDMFRPLGTCLDIVRQVVDQGGDILSRGEIESLDAAANQLKYRYDKCVDQADATHRRLTTASEELSKYEKEIGLFQSWLKQAGKILVEKERHCADLNKPKGFEQSCRDFLGDVIAHQADLRFITMAYQKFYDESSDYLRLVNQFRSSLPDHYSKLQANPYSGIKDAVENVTAEFKDLLSRANKLVDKVICSIFIDLLNCCMCMNDLILLNYYYFSYTLFIIILVIPDFIFTLL